MDFCADGGSGKDNYDFFVNFCLNFYSFKVVELQNFTALICRRCVSTLTNFYDFRLSCLEADEYFRDLSSAVEKEVFESTNVEPVVILQEEKNEKIYKNEPELQCANNFKPPEYSYQVAETAAGEEQLFYGYYHEFPR